MDEEQTTLVYEPFYRVDKARSRSSGEIGLGLSLYREIAHLHGSELKIHSIPGKGTTVTPPDSTAWLVNFIPPAESSNKESFDKSCSTQLDSVTGTVFPCQRLSAFFHC